MSLKILKNSILGRGMDGNGYGRVADKLPGGLAANGAEILGPSDFGWDVLLEISPPRSAVIGPFTYRKDVCFHTMVEGTPTPKPWIEVLNCAHAIWAPSQWVKQTFEESGVKRPIFVAGYAVDGDVYQYLPREERDEPFKFVAWGDVFVSRKNMRHIIEAFHKANVPNSVLEIKLSDNAIRGGGPSSIKPEFDGVPDERITIYSEYWEPMQLVRWLQSADCGIYMSGGEGYGLMPLEMAATGMPVICAANTGMLDYLKPDSFMMVESTGKVPSPSMSVNFNMLMHMEWPNFDQAIEYMRWAEQNRTEAYAMGARAAEYARSWTWKDQCATALKHLQELFG